MESIKVGANYRHSKKQTLHKVIAVAKHSETLEDLVVYEEEGNELSRFWVRPIGMWNEIVEVNGEKVPRFVLVEEK